MVGEDDSLQIVSSSDATDQLQLVPGLSMGQSTVRTGEDEDERIVTGRRRHELQESETDIEEEEELRRKSRRISRTSIVSIDDTDIPLETQHVTEIGDTTEQSNLATAPSQEVSDNEEPAIISNADYGAAYQNVQDQSAEAQGEEEQEQEQELHEAVGEGDDDDIKVLTEEEQIKAQQVIEIDDEDEAEGHKSGKDMSETPLETKKAADYVCPICMEPPEAALVTKCGHIFCTTCLYGMVNSSKGNGRRNGLCALCRENVKLQDLRLIVMRKNRIRKPN
ncbi:Slx8 [Kluyveromyces lactis]|nr:Slx8 [Kluyveromyces lactis]